MWPANLPTTTMRSARGAVWSFDIEDVGLADVLAAIGRRSGFEVTAHRLEVFGRCSACRAGVGRA